MGALRVIIILLLVLAQSFGIPEFMLDGPYWQRMLLYSFFHANWWHLAVNCIAAWSIFVPARKCSTGMLVAAFAIAVLVYPLSFRPVIGFSNILYAVLGLRTPSLSSSWWKQWSVLLFIAVTVAMVFIPQFSATTHIASFAAGVFCASVSRSFNELTKDARRYL